MYYDAIVYPASRKTEIFFKIVASPIKNVLKHE